MNISNPDPSSAGLHKTRIARVGEHLDGRYIKPRKIPGSIVAVVRGGQLGYVHSSGFADIERQRPVAEDTVFRIYSMTKPITSVALMTLWERGLVTLADPIGRFLPELADLRVWTGGSWPNFETRHADRPITVRDLLCHTSGLTYDFMQASNLDYAYRKLAVARPRAGYSFQSFIDQLAGLPLAFSPGERWNYSVATDVLGVLVERISGMPFASYLQETIFNPLEMKDTGFSPREDQLARFASSYTRNAKKELTLYDDAQSSDFLGRQYHSGGGGLVSTIGDYLNFCAMLANRGRFKNRQIIGRKTLDLMTANHLPGDVDLASISMSGFSETANEGVGFGLGFACKQDSVRGATPASPGTYYWGGLASTLFWVDPAEDLVVVFMTQLLPSSTFNFRGQLEALVYAALE
ncbi:MAG: serine hydrolase domain-containing protein [Pseudomonadota bacterium]